MEANRERSSGASYTAADRGSGGRARAIALAPPVHLSPAEKLQEGWGRMPVRSRRFVGLFIPALLACCSIGYSHYIHWEQDIWMSLLAGLYGGSVLIVATAVLGVAAAIAPEEPLPGWLRSVSVGAMIWVVLWASWVMLIVTSETWI